ncbi:primary-amine oxidase [Mycobacterium marinum]|uniref:Amine oxidase n=1 Tax=Mycobacterium marinum (strain ATCC BAA-535 / M) TaxID=216594 RepID=B2HS24_MYCMM|nr:primary-amine oxidase [Mycobacterium marinum]ACC41054.1 copper methylamine oxidase precursor, MaoX [Mycobacterium marinum M]EPQ76383.1 Monoamine oxidase [Mycobacterium marinum MB2]MDC8985295.1 primary-amine oxidase [Mycobacterium marinum]MDC9002575.1 primary-amine oxidase [Mycobacterium marinum]MDC9007545.1 primary-amine oxidase [Mycobacterium marinum]
MTETIVQTFHPLDPLTESEFQQAVSVVRRDRNITERWRFASMELAEPGKREIADFENNAVVPDRRAVIVCFDRDTNGTYKALVSLSGDRILSWTCLPGVQPNITHDEWLEAGEVLRSHPAVIAALCRRGITDLENMLVDVWAYGDALIPEAYRGRRLAWSDSWLTSPGGGNLYARHIKGFHCVIDLNTMELLDIEEGSPLEFPAVMAEYVPRHIPENLRDSSVRGALRPLEIIQPDGPSFTLRGNHLEWQNWSLRVGFNYREGMTLHTVTYNDHGRVRPIAYRMSFAEMAVPYRDHCADHYRRTAFDIGEWGLGFMTTSLEKGCDCLGEIRYLDAVLHNSKGEPYTIKNAICIHEEDNAVLWKHVVCDGSAEVRRMRRLTVSFHVTVANYEYLVYWRFYQDGNIECEIRATGLMVTTNFDNGQAHASGTLVDERTYAPYHQHFLTARLDLDIDGTDNTVYTSETEMVPTGPDNPYGLSLRQRNIPLRTEEEGKQDYCWETQRAWRVVNENVTNGLGTHPSYKLVGGAAIPPMFDLRSPVLRRAEAITHTVWVTPNHPDERWPAGEFVNQSGPGLGLPAWTAANRSIENTDVVVWYTFGIHHITRPEDWPVMPADTVSFWLKPVGFFDRNPSLDVAPTAAATCHGEGGC